MNGRKTKMQTYKAFLKGLMVLFTCLIIVACGGSGDVPDPDPDPDPGEETTYSMALSFHNTDTGDALTLNSVSDDQPVDVRATISDDANNLIANQIVEFSLSNNKGILGADSDLTDTSGVAQVRLLAGIVKGAGTVIATSTVESQALTASINFETAGDSEVIGETGAYNVDISLSNTTTSDASHIVVTFNVDDGDDTTNNEQGLLVTFTTTGIGELSPNSGTALTDASGNAVIDLRAGTVAGAGIIKGTLTNGQSDSIGFQSLGDSGGSDSSLTGATISLELLTDPNDNTSDSNQLSFAQKLYPTAIVVDANGSPIENVLVSYSTTIGRIIPGTGTALTNANGQAQITLETGTVEGAGEITAQIGDIDSDSIAFYSAGDEPTDIPSKIALQLLDSTGAVTTTITAGSPGTLVITAREDNANSSPYAGLVVAATTTIGELSPATALTDSSGEARISILAGDDTGAGTVTVTERSSSKSLSFEIGEPNLRLGACDTSTGTADCSAFAEGVLETPNGTALAAGATTTVVATIVDENTNPFTTSIDVNFSSACASAGKAILDNKVATLNGYARATYRANGCIGEDIIQATANSAGDVLNAQVSLIVDESPASSIQFVSAEPTNIAIAGSGGAGRSETSTVIFRVFDETGLAKPNQVVDFSLSSTLGGTSISPLSAETNTEGFAQTIVQAGSVAQTVRIFASVDLDGDNVSDFDTQSDQLVISTGVPDQNSMTLAATSLNPGGWDFVGIEDQVTVRLADHFNNPVPDGTAVTFSTEFGSIQPSCTTIDGGCTVKWVSQNPTLPDPILRDPKAILRDLDSHGCPFDIDGNGTVTLTEMDEVQDSNSVNYVAPTGLPCLYNNATSALIGAGTTGEPVFYGGLGPFYKGRSTILATAIGEESFVDANGNGKYDAGEAFGDLAEAFRDENEDGVFGARDSSGAVTNGSAADEAYCYESYRITEECWQVGGDNEEFVDFSDGAGGSPNGIFDLGNGIYNGVLCPENLAAAGTCSRNTLNVRAQLTLIMSDDAARIWAQESRSNLLPSQPVNTSNGAKSIIIYITDLNNNVMPAGTIVDISGQGTALSGGGSFAVPSTNGFGVLGYAVAVSPDDEATGGSVSIKVTTPSTETVGSTITSATILVDETAPAATISAVASNSLTYDADGSTTITPNDVITLNGSASTGQSLSYFWTQTAGPVVDVVNKNSFANPRVQPTLAGNYEFTLTVVDSVGSTRTTTTSFTVN
jgi:hypothetical protein